MGTMGAVWDWVGDDMVRANGPVRRRLGPIGWRIGGGMPMGWRVPELADCDVGLWLGLAFRNIVPLVSISPTKTGGDVTPSLGCVMTPK